MDITETVVASVDVFSRNFEKLRKFLSPKIHLTLISAFRLNEKSVMTLFSLIVESLENLRFSELLGRHQCKLLRAIKLFAFSELRSKLHSAVHYDQYLWSF